MSDNLDKATAIQNALESIDGIASIDSKNEFAELPNVLDEGEIPAMAIKCSVGMGSGLMVATDRRVVWLRKGRNLNVREMAYAAMDSVESKVSGWSGGTITFAGTATSLEVSNATKSLTLAFADFVREKAAAIDVPLEADQASAEEARSEAALKSLLAGIDPDNPKSAAIRDALRAIPDIQEIDSKNEFAELPNVLDDDELPVLAIKCSVGMGSGLMVATDRRVVWLRKGRSLNVQEMAYAAMDSVESKVSGWSGGTITFAGTATSLEVSNATKSLTLAFADFVREKAAPFIAAAADAEAEAADRTKARAAEAADRTKARAKEIAEALQASGGDRTVFTKWEFRALPSILVDGELPEMVVSGRYNSSNGILVATDRRLLFVDKGFLGSLQVEDFPYSTIQSVHSSSGAIFGSITIKSAGSTGLIENVPKHLANDIGNFVRTKSMDANATTATVTTEKPSASDQVGLADELLKLSQLRDAGILSDEEFRAQKSKLLA